MIPRASWKLPSLVAGCLVLMVVLSAHLVPYLPPPAGPFRVGTVLWGIDRLGPSSLPPGREVCPISVQLWYPAEPGSGGTRAPYRPARAGLLSAARWVRTSAILDAALSSHRVRYPVLLSLPGWAGSRGENTTFVQDLASRGFIVAGIGYDDPACARVVGSSDDAATGMDFSSQAAF